jgi:hypothetical protein
MTDRPTFVVQPAVRDADTVAIDVGARIEADPFALGLAMEVDREIGVGCTH